MDTINRFEITYNEYLHLHAESEVEFNHLELKKHAMEALLTDIVWNLRPGPEDHASAAEEETWCWLLSQMGLAIKNASRLEVAKEQEPLDVVISAAAWFKDNRVDLAARIAQDGNGREAGSGGLV